MIMSDKTDERDYIEYESPMRLDVYLQLLPPQHRWISDGMSQCSDCGKNSQPRPTSELTVIKHRHGGQPLGHLRTYCQEHLAVTTEWHEGGSAGRSARTGAVCPTCHMTLPLTGICDNCG